MKAQIPPRLVRAAYANVLLDWDVKNGGTVA
jgi:hypothetical protein